MAEVNDDVIDDVTDVTDDNNTTGLDDETTKALKHFGIDPNTATTDDLIKVAMRGYKSEQKIISEKKSKPETKPESGEFITKADLAMEKFLDKNPDLADYRDELASYHSKGIPLEKAKLLVEADDKTIANREKASKATITGGESGGEKTSYTTSELEGMSQAEYSRAMERIESGKAKRK